MAVHNKAPDHPTRPPMFIFLIIMTLIRFLAVSAERDMVFDKGGTPCLMGVDRFSGMQTKAPEHFKVASLF